MPGKLISREGGLLTPSSTVASAERNPDPQNRTARSFFSLACHQKERHSADAVKHKLKLNNCGAARPKMPYG